MMQRVIPKVFYADLADGLNLFVAGLGFRIGHRDQTLVVERDGAKAYLVEDAVFAAKDRPVLAIETDTIDALYAEVSRADAPISCTRISGPSRSSWSAREFAVRDSTQVCVVFRAW